VTEPVAPPPERAEAPELLLVEDDAGDIELAVHALRRAALDIRVTVARDGPAALALLDGRDRPADSPPPCLMLLDLKLPGMHGLAVLEAAKANPRTRPIPIVVLSAALDPEELARAYELGANGCIRKPADFAALAEVLGRTAAFWLGANRTAGYGPSGG
jgi:two-component system response regulator